MENTNLSQSKVSSPKDNLFGVATLFLLVATVFVGTLFIKELRSKGADNLASISVSGMGEIYAVPDIATVSFTIREQAKTSEEATNKMADKEKKALEFLKSAGVDSKDIKTLWFNTYPEYEYTRSLIPCTPTYCPPNSGKQEISGYTASETIQVKVRDIDKAGSIVGGITAVGVGEVDGPQFTVDNPDAKKAEARKLAIEDAKQKAEILRKDLGVRLVRIISYSEGGDYPVYFGAVANDSIRKESSQASVPEFSTGEQKIISNVTIVYEIK